MLIVAKRAGEPCQQPPLCKPPTWEVSPQTLCLLTSQARAILPFVTQPKLRSIHVLWLPDTLPPHIVTRSKLFWSETRDARKDPSEEASGPFP